MQSRSIRERRSAAPRGMACATAPYIAYMAGNAASPASASVQFQSSLLVRKECGAPGRPRLRQRSAVRLCDLCRTRSGLTETPTRSPTGPNAGL
jgi:hypothetical protein